MDPPHAVRKFLASSNLQRRLRGIHPDDLDALPRQQAGQLTGPAPHIQNLSSAELRDHRDVMLQIPPPLLQRVVQRRQPRHPEQVINHLETLTLQGTPRPTD
jgi:hypothetical protein